MGSTTFKHTKRDTPKMAHDNLNHKTQFAERLSLESDYSLKEWPKKTLADIEYCYFQILWENLFTTVLLNL